MKVKVKSIKEIHATDADGNVREHDVEIHDKHGESTGQHERKPVVEHVEVQLVDADDAPVATLNLNPSEAHGLEEGGEYDSVHGHVYEHAAKKAA